MNTTPNSLKNGPDDRGFFGLYGGRFVAETLMPLILELEAAYEAAKQDPTFKAEMESYGTHYIGRPSPLYYAERLTEHLRAKAPAGQGANRSSRDSLGQGRSSSGVRRASQRFL